MKLNLKSSLVQSSFTALVMLFLFASTPAQEAGGQASAAATPKTEKPAAAPQREEKSDEVAQLKTKLEQLQILVEQQQRTLAEMQQRLQELDGKTPIAARAALTTTKGDAVSVGNEVR